MNNKVIEVLDYMGEKLGIAIDWTADNVMPQVMEFLGRYRIYGITYDCVWLLVFVAMIILPLYLCSKIYKQYKAKDGFFYYEDFSTCFATIAGGIAVVVGVVGSIADVFEIIKWVVIPEMKFVEVFSQYLK